MQRCISNFRDYIAPLEPMILFLREFSKQLFVFKRVVKLVLPGKCGLIRWLKLAKVKSLYAIDIIISQVISLVRILIMPGAINDTYEERRKTCGEINETLEMH